VNIMSLKAAFFALSACCGIAYSAGCSEWQKEIVKNISDLAQRHDHKKSSSSELVGRMSIYEPVDNMDAIFQMWTMGKGQPELYWWKSDDPSIRAFVLALMLPLSSDAGHPVAGVPDFSSSIKRFEPGEEKKRLEEYEFVKTNALAIYIVKMYEKYGFKSDSYSAYKHSAKGAPNSDCKP
jgi:hypothetical protein